jgi:hypothetical protein
VLNVSHRDLLNLLAEGEIPLRDEGPGLLIQREKLLEYKRRKRAVAEEAMGKTYRSSPETGARLRTRSPKSKRTMSNVQVQDAALFVHGLTASESTFRSFSAKRSNNRYNGHPE